MNNQSQPTLTIISLLWTLIGLTFLVLGSIYWFHFPYLLYLDEWHLLWAIASLCIGLVIGWILDLVADSVINRLLTQAHLNGFQILDLKTLILLFLLISSGFFLKNIILSRAMQGLVDLALGTAFIWSSRNYWRRLLFPLNSSQL